MKSEQTNPVRYMPMSFPKICACGRSYAENEWKLLPFSGIWRGIDEKGRRFSSDLEMRDCVCQSSIAVPIMIEGT